MNEVFRALSDPTRREILRHLRQRDHTAGELAALFQISKSTLSGHFNVLKAAELIAQDKRGTTVTYRLNTGVFEEVVAHLFDLFGHAAPVISSQVASSAITSNQTTSSHAASKESA
jgi:ArsR family transcriptional regulator, arsenate/arsenite/antimonite-responsive transcriptional repressor